MKSIDRFFNYSSLSNFFVKQENQISQSLEKRILLVAVGIFALLTLVFLTRYYLKNGVGSKEKVEEEEEQINLANGNVTPKQLKVSDPLSEGATLQQGNPNGPVSAGATLQQGDRSLPIIPNLVLERIKSLFLPFKCAPQIFPCPDLVNKKDEVRSIYHQQCALFDSFLSEQLTLPVKTDVIYFSIGHGGVAEQIWPGFIFKTLQSGKTVKTYLIEDGWGYSNFRNFQGDLRGQYHAYSKTDLDEATIATLNNFSIDQFLCGFPNPRLKDNCYEDSMNIQGSQTYQFIGNLYWKNRQQALDVIKKFNQYIEKILAEGKTVVLGDHRGALSMDDELIVLYNQLAVKYPGQIYFLWGWGRSNLMTQQALRDEDLFSKKRSLPWTYHENLSTTALNFP